MNITEREKAKKFPPTDTSEVPFQGGAECCGREKRWGGRKRDQWCDLSFLQWKMQNYIEP